MPPRDVSGVQPPEQLQSRLEELALELARTRARLDHLEQLSSVGTWETDLRSGESHWSDEVFRLLGLRPQLFAPRPRTILQLVHPGDRHKLESVLTRAIIGMEPYDAEYRIIRPSGEERILRTRAEVAYEGGEAVRFFGTIQDITESRRAEQLVRESERRFRLIAESVEDLFWTGTPGLERITYLSPAFQRIFQCEPAMIYADASRLVELIHPDDRDRYIGALGTRVEGPWRLEYRIVRPDGTLRWVDDRGAPVVEEGTVWLLAGTLRDITDLKAAETVLLQTLRSLADERDRAENAKAELARANALLERMTLQDPLTGVANRRFLERFIAREWRRERRHGHVVSGIMADIDYFKHFNDHYGHLVGDHCLRKVADALASKLRRPTDILVRYGGEEFLMVLLETDAAGAGLLAETLRTSVEALGIPHEKSETAPVVTISVGVATVSAREMGFGNLLEKADEALYAAKATGRNRVVVC